MALVTLNTSVDVPDNLLYAHLSKSKMVNEMESIAEILAECILHTDFEFEEQREDDSNGNNLAKKITPIKFKQDLPEFSLLIASIIDDVKSPEEVTAFTLDFIKEITPPPPKV